MSNFLARLALSLLFFGSVVLAGEIRSGRIPDHLDKRYDLPSVGRVRIVYDYTGEPLVSPARLKIHVQCRGADRERELVTLPMCALRSYRIQEDLGFLELSYSTGRVDDQARASCDQREGRKISVADYCRALSHRNP